MLWHRGRGYLSPLGMEVLNLPPFSVGSPSVVFSWYLQEIPEQRRIHGVLSRLPGIFRENLADSRIGGVPLEMNSVATAKGSMPVKLAEFKLQRLLRSRDRESFLQEYKRFDEMVEYCLALEKRPAKHAQQAETSKRQQPF